MTLPWRKWLSLLFLVTTAQAETDELYHSKLIPVRAMKVTDWEVTCGSDHGYYDWVKFHPNLRRDCKKKRIEVQTGRGIVFALAGDWIVLETPYNHMNLNFYVFTQEQFQRLFEKE